MGNRRSQGSITSQKVNNHTIEELIDSEVDETSVSKFKGIMISMFKDLEEDIQKQIT
jgi:hypothetical protein